MKSVSARLGAIVLSVSAVCAFGIQSNPASAAPDIADVKKRVDTLYHQAEVAQERYHDANLRLTELRNSLKAVKADEAKQDQRFAQVSGDVRDSVIRQYQGEGIATVGEVFVSPDPSSFLGEMSTMSAYSDYQESLFGDYATQLKALNLRKDATKQKAAEIAATTAALREQKREVEQKLAEAKEVLSDLEAKERERLLAASRGSSPRVPLTTSVPASGRAGAAIAYAMAQVGDAYVYGAAGPNAFDCSGLTMMAWAQAGVGLPHSSSAQFGTGTRVSTSALQPGDLVFYYSPISHVALYIGNGMIVHAANPGAGVRVDSMGSMPIAGAVRPG